MACRNHAELENVVGDFVNTVVLRVNLQVILHPSHAIMQSM